MFCFRTFLAGPFYFYREFNLPEDGGDMLAAFKRAGKTDRTALEVGFQRDFGGAIEQDTGCLLDLEDHLFEAMEVIIVEDDVPGKIDPDGLLRDRFDFGKIENFGAHS